MTKIRWWAWQARKFGSDLGEHGGEGSRMPSPQSGEIHMQDASYVRTMPWILALMLIIGLMLPLMPW
jgi:hypothetical protein